MVPPLPFIGMIGVTLLTQSAHSLTLDAQRVKDDLAQSDFEAIIQIDSQETISDPTFHKSRLVSARVLDSHARLTDKRLRIRIPGGESNSLGVFYPGFPVPYPGERYEAHLKAGLDDIYEVVGYERGLVPLVHHRNYSINRTDGSDGAGSGPYLKWDASAFPLPYFISSTFFSHSTWMDAIDASFKTWRDIADIGVEFIGMGCTSVQNESNDGINAIVYITNSWAFGSAAIAVTRNFYVAGNSPRGGQLLDSDILLNGVDYTFSTDNTIGTHDVQNIVTHEIGHFVGLGHEVAPTDSNATMYATAVTNETKKRVLKSNDLAGARLLYQGISRKGTFVTGGCKLRQAVGCGATRSGATPSPAWCWILILVLPILLRKLPHLSARLRG